MQESDLFFDCNIVDYEFKRNASNHPHDIWFDDETLRDGLQSPGARNPTIEEKIELLTYMERLGVQKVDLGLPGAGPRGITPHPYHCACLPCKHVFVSIKTFFAIRLAVSGCDMSRRGSLG